MPSPRVTVIVATYNWSTVLPYAIASVLDQTMRDFELLVVGDGCTDDSEQVVAGIRDPRVRWINLPANTGHQFGPNNRGLEEAKGEFIAYLGHDDLWLPHHLQCAVDALELTGAAITYSLVIRIQPDCEIGRLAMPMPDHGLVGPPSCTVYRRSVTEKIGGWGDYRKLDLTPEIDLLRRAQAAGFQLTQVPRLTVVKFPAAKRKDVYRERPFHEQAAWLERIRAEPDFEATQLVRVIMSGEAARAMPARTLIPLFARELKQRLIWRLSRRSGLTAMFWRARGSGIDYVKRFKGL
jgi:GT2 family glycosyltransferase